MLQVVSNTELVRREQEQAAISEANMSAAAAAPLASPLAAHIRQCWDAAVRHKIYVEERMLRNQRNRRGEYDATTLAKIRETGGSEIFMMLTSVKCRAASSWLRDMLLGQRADKPWGIEPTPVPDLSPVDKAQIEQFVAREAAEVVLAQKMGIDQGLLAQRVEEIKTEARERMRQLAKERAKRMEDKMEDQLLEGGWREAFNQFIDDLTVYPSAVMKGPVVRRRPRLQWTNSNVFVAEELTEEFERVDPYNIYPAPHATAVDDGYLCERHRLQRRDLQALLGVPGYRDDEIRAVLTEYGAGGLKQWLWTDSARERLEDRDFNTMSPEQPIDAVQFWGSVPGIMLMQWGLSGETLDPTREYNIEAWLVGTHVIKAVMNPHPLGLKPYFKTSYEEIPGSFWGNAIADLIVDCQAMCNAAARAISNNMGMASGPQVAFNRERLPAGYEPGALRPWKTWQFMSDPMGSTAKPIEFFQPEVVVDPLMRVFEFFSNLADEYSGMPRYMSGMHNVGGAARTASGFSMLVDNAGKGIKQVVANIDVRVTSPLVSALHLHNMIYSDDMELKGDVRIIARGATVAVAKEALRLRRNEFLMATANPLDSAILGAQGRASILREQAKDLEIPVDDLIPPRHQILVQQAIQQALQSGQMLGSGRANQPGVNAPAPTMGPGQAMPNGAPITDNFSPMAA